MDEIKGKVILNRFSGVIRQVVTRVVREFKILPDDREDVEQDASILVLTYAGLADGRHSGIISDWERLSEGNETRVKGYAAKMLRLDLSEMIGRRLKMEPGQRPVSLNALQETGFDASEEGFEYYLTERLDNKQDAERMHRLYPTLSATILDDLTQIEAAALFDVTDRTIRNRIDAEKRAFLMAYIQEHGLCFEGNETMEELVECFNNLSRRQGGVKNE